MLESDSVSVTYRTPAGSVTALDGISIQLSATDRTGLVGPSGSGKSTLARVLALLLKPESGRVEIDGVQVRKWGIRAPRYLRRRVQLLWQSPRQAVDPRLRLADVILEPLAASGLSPRREDRTDLLSLWAGRVGLTRDLLSRFPHEVSEGQLQRACLARAMVLEPKYLICDEPSSMLDVSTQAALMEIMANEQESREMGVLLITHDRILADHWCDSVLDLRKLSRAAKSTRSK